MRGVRPGCTSKARRWFAIVALVAALLVVVVAILDISNVSSVAEAPLDLEPNVGSGLILTLVAGVVAVAGCILAIRSKHRTPVSGESAHEEGGRFWRGSA